VKITDSPRQLLMFYCLIAMAYFGNETTVSVFVKIAVVSLLGIS
jgi:hypothetical protein